MSTLWGKSFCLSLQSLEIFVRSPHQSSTPVEHRIRLVCSIQGVATSRRFQVTARTNWEVFLTILTWKNYLWISIIRLLLLCMQPVCSAISLRSISLPAHCMSGQWDQCHVHTEEAARRIRRRPVWTASCLWLWPVCRAAALVLSQGRDDSHWWRAWRRLYLRSRQRWQPTVRNVAGHNAQDQLRWNATKILSSLKLALLYNRYWSIAVARKIQKHRQHTCNLSGGHVTEKLYMQAKPAD